MRRLVIGISAIAAVLLIAASQPYRVSAKAVQVTAADTSTFIIVIVKKGDTVLSTDTIRWTGVVPPVVDTTPAHIVIAYTPASPKVGDMVNVTVQCYAKGNILAPSPGYIHAGDASVLQFTPSTVQPPAKAKALKVGSTTIISVCWPSGPSGIESTTPITVIQGTASVDSTTVDSVLVLPRSVALAPADSDCASLPESQKFDSTGTPVWQCNWVDPFGKVIATSVTQYCAFLKTPDGMWHLSTDQQLSTPCIKFARDSTVVHPFSNTAIAKVPTELFQAAMRAVHVQVL